jgi:hypothetical protein
MATGPRPPGPISLPKGITWEILQVNGGQLSAVCGESESIEPGVWGTNDAAGVGVLGNSMTGEGVLGEGTNGVHGKSGSATNSGIWGENTGAGYGVSGSTNSSYQPGPNGTAGVWGDNAGTGVGVKGTSSGGDAVVGISSAQNHAGVSAVNTGGGFGVWASGQTAGHFEGTVEIDGILKHIGDLSHQGNATMTGTMTAHDVVLSNSDCAEDFDISGSPEIEPGTVMVIDQDGALRQSYVAYDQKVAGVISGGGDLKPGIVLGKQASKANRMPIALVGKVYCKVDASDSPIEIGDLLTTSTTPGHAMKAANPDRAFGSVIGKALQSLASGRGLIPMLVVLQ